MNSFNWQSEGFRRGAVLTGVFICALLIMQGMFGKAGWFALRQRRREYKALSLKLQELQQENHQLQKEVLGLRSSPATIERYAREELHMARRGEVIYILPQAPAGGKAAVNGHPHQPQP